ncbi:MAG: AraC family transcriptional regulator N-terminal domain-containing protein [Paraglaciecola sp.]|nr:AraC family transcriptional regulator N-terminal domain-containing protein [Paraglaciecola sp.]
MNNVARGSRLGLDQPKKLIENRVSFAGPDSELSIYDTYLPAEKVLLRSSGLLYCGMIQGKKVLHGTHAQQNTLQSQEFVPHQSFVMAANTSIEIDFPEACMHKPTRCLTVEISVERIALLTEQLDARFGAPLAFDSWHSLSNQHLHTQHSHGTQMLLERLFNSFIENESERNIAIDFGVSELVARILKHQARDVVLSESLENSENSGLQTCVHYIKTHLSEHLDIDSLCKMACMSRSRFYQEFKQKLGCSPLALQQQLRINHAAKRLTAGESVSQVCFSLGYTSLSHFNRRFQEQYSMPPSVFSRNVVAH